MKKNLFNLFLIITLFFAEDSLSQQISARTIQSQSSSNFSDVQTGPKSSGSNAVITTTTSSCMSINLPAPPTWSLVNYGTGTPFAANGFVNGQNTYADKEKAMYFDASASANTMITQIYVGFGKAYTSTPTKTVGIKIYDGTSGTPGAVALGSGTLAMSTIMSDVAASRYSLLMFPTPINLPASKRFFVSVDISGLVWNAGTKDSLSIVSNTSPQTNPGVAWEKWSTNAWYNMNSTSSWTLNISLLIHPFLTQAPIIATMSTSSNTVCTGKSITYNSAGSTSPGTYDWYFGSVPTPTATGVTAMATYTSTGTYTTTLIMRDACGSFGINSRTISVIQTPTVNATPVSTTICNGKSVTLSGSGASTYTWTGGITNGIAFTPSVSGNYTVTGTAANSCTNFAVSSVVVNPNPTITINSSTTSVCSGNNLTLTGNGASTYTWTGGVSNGVAFTPTSTSTYTVNGTAANTCTSSSMITVTVAPNPTVTANITSTVLCSGTNLTLSGNGASTYTWTGGITNNTPFAATISSNYTVTGIGANGCIGTAVSNVSVNANPTVTAMSTASAVCNGGTVTLNGNGATTYTWSGSVSNGVTFTPTATSNYTVIGTNANGCTDSDVTSIIVNSNPTVVANTTATLICIGNSVTLSGAGANTYTWTGGVSNAVAFSPTVTSSYTVTGTDLNGCKNVDSINVVVAACAGISNINNSKTSIKIFPNPNNGEFYLSVDGTYEIHVEIYDAIGKLIFQKSTNSPLVKIAEDFAPGLYTLKVFESNQLISTNKIIRN